MPELPEVETVVRNLRNALMGKTFSSFRVFWKRSVQPSGLAVRRICSNRTIAALTRRGKWIVFELSGNSRIAIHLRMSGRLWLSESAAVSPSYRHIRAEWIMSDGSRLLFEDARKFGRIRAGETPDEVLPPLGAEPLEANFTAQMLSDILARGRSLKPLLLDQRRIAGIGNIYADEILFDAGLHPLTRSDTLRGDATDRLHRSIRMVLERAIKQQGTSFDWVYPNGNMQHYLHVYGRTGESCTRCGSKIERILVGQRSSHICPNCQRTPRVARRLLRSSGTRRAR
jgi:formamidopyrimidine-DNA glycosylase